MKASRILKNSGKVILSIYPSFDSCVGPNPSLGKILGKILPSGWLLLRSLTINSGQTDTVKFCGTKK